MATHKRDMQNTECGVEDARTQPPKARQGTGWTWKRFMLGIRDAGITSMIFPASPTSHRRTTHEGLGQGICVAHTSNRNAAATKGAVDERVLNTSSLLLTWGFFSVNDEDGEDGEDGKGHVEGYALVSNRHTSRRRKEIRVLSTERKQGLEARQRRNYLLHPNSAGARAKGKGDNVEADGERGGREGGEKEEGKAMARDMNWKDEDKGGREQCRRIQDADVLYDAMPSHSSYNADMPLRYTVSRINALCATRSVNGYMQYEPIKRSYQKEPDGMGGYIRLRVATHSIVGFVSTSIYWA
ncbi:hypothetical protein BDN71DRAFT_1499874 [Pleurotus eryngii]|uniref:Uncharacterized protein n=1 Tax=Pleurotus eryngii TaxID=5323 RepID=A0A9P5ZH09_PLEER|nr:hypothetical protein BDN71DRAFT_1499874 [Pleurotus eryngii]